MKKEGGEMEILIGLGLCIAGLTGLVFGVKSQNTKRKLKTIEEERKSKLEIEAQRYEKLREILTDGVVSGQPVALEALKPLVEAIADQTKAEMVIERLELEHKHRLEEIEAQQQPLIMTLGQFASLDVETVDDLRTLLLSVQGVPAVPQLRSTDDETSALPPHPESKQKGKGEER